MKCMTAIGLMLLAVGTGGFQKMCSTQPSADDLDRQAAVVVQTVCDAVRDGDEGLPTDLAAEFDWDGFERRGVVVDEDAAAVLIGARAKLRGGYQIVVTRDGPLAVASEEQGEHPLRWARVDYEGETLAQLRIVFSRVISVELVGDANRSP